MSVHLAGNALREDFTFRHTFSSEVSKLLKASPGQIVIVQPEKFRSKYEPASHTLSVKVILVCLFNIFEPLAVGNLAWLSRCEHTVTS